MAKVPYRPEEDPAEGSREVIDRELAKQDEKQQGAQSGPDKAPSPRQPGGRKD